MYYRYFYILSLCLLLGGCNTTSQKYSTFTQGIDLPEIVARDTLIAVTLNTSTSYFTYKMRPMGEDYEMIKSFAEWQGLTLKIIVAENEIRLKKILLEEKADIVAYPTPINRLDSNIIYCGKEDFSTQVLVQRSNKKDTLLNNVIQLIGKSVYIKKGSRYHQRLKNLNNELGGGIHICDIGKDTITNEDLIEMVSLGTIPYTISDEKVAKLNKTYFWNIDTSLKISFLQQTSWMVRKTSPMLADAINQWATDSKTKRTFKRISKRYFELSKNAYVERKYQIKNGHISPFDSLFKKHAKVLKWDWQILASIAYQESRFKTNLVSWAGAEGLMGIMPATAKTLGVTPHELKNPEVGIRVGVECLMRFRAGFNTIKNPSEKIKFTLASYNAGIGHVFDAQRLAKKYGKDPLVWDKNVAEYIRLKSEPKYYKDEVCKHGYLRGKETYNYVAEVVTRYHYYKSKTR